MSRSEFTANLQMATVPTAQQTRNPLAPTAAELARAKARAMAPTQTNFIARLLAFGRQRRA